MKYIDKNTCSYCTDPMDITPLEKVEPTNRYDDDGNEYYMHKSCFEESFPQNWEDYQDC